MLYSILISRVHKYSNFQKDTLRYYERIGMIPAVPRTSGGIRNYGEADLGWIELALCMRNAGLPVESMIEYVHLFQEGDETIPARLHLLLEQKEHLIEQQNKISQMLKRLEYKISRYEEAVQTGKLVWNEDKAEECRKR